MGPRGHSRRCIRCGPTSARRCGSSSGSEGRTIPPPFILPSFFKIIVDRLRSSSLIAIPLEGPRHTADLIAPCGGPDGIPTFSPYCFGGHGNDGPAGRVVGRTLAPSPTLPLPYHRAPLERFPSPRLWCRVILLVVSFVLFAASTGDKTWCELDEWRDPDPCSPQGIPSHRPR
jgi:hypothetical protein